MPKVSQEHRQARRLQILDAAKRCFLREGFHETSMQDIFTESGLSSGSVYRYFASKDDVILAIAEENMRDVTTMIHALPTDRPGASLGAVLAEVLEVIRDKHAQNDLGAIAVLVWSEALRIPALAREFDTLFGQMRASVGEVVRNQQAHGVLPKDADPEALTTLLLSIVPGFILQLSLFGHKAVAGVPDAARALWSLS